MLKRIITRLFNGLMLFRMIRLLKKKFLRREFEYYDNDFVKVSKSFFKNVPEGKWKYYKSDGTIERMLKYNNGSVVVEYFYTHDGLLYKKNWYSPSTRVEIIKSEIREYFSRKKRTTREIKEYVANNSTNKVVVLLAVEFAPSCIQYADASLKKDKEVVLEAVRLNGWALQYADESLKKDKEVVLEAVERHAIALVYADESLQKDKDFILAAAKKQGESIFFLANKSLKKDKDFILEAVKRQSIALYYADESLKKDKDFILAAVSQDPSALSYADESLKKDKEVVLEAVRLNGSALEYADESLKKDKELIWETEDND